MEGGDGLPRSRAEAIDAGVKKYFTGKPCKCGHVEFRYTLDGQCGACQRIKALERYHIGGEAAKAAARQRAAKRYLEDADYRERCKNYQSALRLSADGGEKKRSYDRKRRAERDKRQIEKDREYIRNYQLVRHRTSAKARLDRSMTGGIYRSIGNNKAGARWCALVGYSSADLMSHLESKFAPGMTWDNYGRGGWHVDHIVPKAAFNYQTSEDEDFKRCWALSNLQPLWEMDNISKGAKLNHPLGAARAGLASSELEGT